MAKLSNHVAHAERSLGSQSRATSRNSERRNTSQRAEGCCRRGRPATGEDPLVSARLPRELVEQIEAWATDNAASRSEAIRRLVEIWLRAKGT